MGRNKGNLNLAANFQVKIQEALDPRLVVENKVDLINKDTWPSDGDTLYVYEGMIVSVSSEKSLYTLTDISKILNSDYSGWLKIGATDSEISDVSTNAVQNKVVKEYIDLHPQYENVDEIDVPEINLPMVDCDLTLNATSIKPVQNRVITQALDDKVDKVYGKQLSAEDFTKALKTKLEGLKNYDDTDLKNSINNLTTQINTLVKGDASAAIESFNEITAFLNGIEDSENLNSIIAVIEQQIAGKMDDITLAKVATSGSYNDLNDKPTIPSEVTESTVSGWGFTKNTGTYSKPSAGIPKSDLASAVQTSLGKADTALQSHQDISGKQDKLISGTSIKTINGESILGSGDITVVVDTSNFATKTEVNAKQDIIPDIETIRSGAALGATALQEHQDISYLATKEELTNITNEIIDDEEVLAYSLNELNDRVNNISEELSGDFATKEEFDSAIENLNAADSTNQQVIESVSESVTELSERVDNIASELSEDFATKEEVQTTSVNLTNEVIDDEEVLAYAIVDLDERIKALVSRIEILEANNI